MSLFDAPRQLDPDIIGSDDDVPLSHPSVGRQPFGDRFPQRVASSNATGVTRNQLAMMWRGTDA